MKTDDTGFYQGIDRFLFIRNGVSIMRYIIPFSIIAFLFLVVPIPKEDLIYKLINSLQQTNNLLLAGILSIILFIIYFFFIKAQIREAYLISNGELLRAVLSSLLFVFLCSLMAFLVIAHTTTIVNKFSILASYGIAILTSMGVGWTIPDSWVDSMRLKDPDYSNARKSVEDITDILKKIRSTELIDENVYEVKLKASAEKLKTNIEENLNLEPSYIKEKSRKIIENLENLINGIDALEQDNPSQIDTEKFFRTACKGQGQHKGQIEIGLALNGLGSFWPVWKIPQH